MTRSYYHIGLTVISSYIVIFSYAHIVIIPLRWCCKERAGHWSEWVCWHQERGRCCSPGLDSSPLETENHHLIIRRRKYIYYQDFPWIEDNQRRFPSQQSQPQSALIQICYHFLLLKLYSIPWPRFSRQNILANFIAVLPDILITLSLSGHRIYKVIFQSLENECCVMDRPLWQ